LVVDEEAAGMLSADLEATARECRRLIATRFPAGESRGAAAVLLDDGAILTGSSPDPDHDPMGDAAGGATALLGRERFPRGSARLDLNR
jgi:hypothetical protein